MIRRLRSTTTIAGNLIALSYTVQEAEPHSSWRNTARNFAPVYAQAGIGGYDLKSPANCEPQWKAGPHCLVMPLERHRQGTIGAYPLFMLKLGLEDTTSEALMTSLYIRLLLKH
jgi:hypothetical protein